MEASRAVGFERSEVTTFGPRTKTARVAATAEATVYIQRLEVLAGGANILRIFELSVVRGIGSQMMGIFLRNDGPTSFPSVGKKGAGTVSILLSGKNISVTPARLEKARVLPEGESSQGLARRGDRVRVSKPAAPRSLFAELLNRGTPPGACIQENWASWAYFHQNQSECLLLVRRLPP